jgi:type II secretory pathway predicted ATPase ExeA
MPNEAPLEVAERHVREAAMRVERQRKLIAELHSQGHSTVEAERVLTSFEMTHREFENVMTSLQRRTK